MFLREKKKKTVSPINSKAAFVRMQIFTRHASNFAQKYPLSFVAYPSTAFFILLLYYTFTIYLLSGLLARPRSFYLIMNCKPTWKICLREKRARRSSRPSLFSNFSATDKQHATIYYNNIACTHIRAVVVSAFAHIVAGAPFCKGPHFQITVLKATVMKRLRLP